LSLLFNIFGDGSAPHQWQQNPSSKVVEILVGWGADINAKDHQGLTALDVAEHHGKAAVTRRLRGDLAGTSRG
jgi:ankyrin repeat protein